MRTNWKRRILIAAIPLAAVTVGCLAAQDDMHEVVGDELRASGDILAAKNIHLSLNDTLQTKIEFNDAAADAAIAAREAMEMAREGGKSFDDLILVSLFDDPIGVGFGVDAEGNADACTIEIAGGAQVLGEASVRVELTTGRDFGGFSTLQRVDSEEACDRGGGFFFEETEAGPFGQISMCPSSCDSMLTAQDAGAQMMVDVVIDHG